MYKADVRQYEASAASIRSIHVRHSCHNKIVTLLVPAGGTPLPHVHAYIPGIRCPMTYGAGTPSAFDTEEKTNVSAVENFTTFESIRVLIILAI